MFFPVPRQQLVDAVDLMVGNAAQHVLQVFFWINVVEFASLDQGINGRSPFAAFIRTGKKKVFSSQNKSSLINCPEIR